MLNNYDIKKILIKYFIYPCYQLFFGDLRYYKNLKSCIKNQYKSRKDIINDQKDALYDIVMYAKEHVPFYKSYISENNVFFSKETIFEDIKKLPVITKEIIRNQKDKLYSDENIDYFIETSGGSTGEPIQLRHDVELRLRHPGDYFLSYAGYEIGDKLFLIWGSEKDIEKGTLGLRVKFENYFIFRKRFFNSFRMTDSGIEKCICCMNRFKPKVILAYVQSIYEIANYIQRKHIKVHSPNGIVVSAGNLYPEWKNMIEETFKCKVYNQYGSRETPGLACGCENEGLHINSFFNYIEVLDENNENIINASGRIIVSNLYNKSMPILRYEIGDIGVMSDAKECPCKRTLPLLKSVVGRDVNIFKLKDGTKIDGEYFTHLFYGIVEIKKFQVIQSAYDEIDIRIVLNSGMEISKERIEKLKKGIWLVMGTECKIVIRYVDEIEPSPSGKFLYTISNID